MWCAGLAAQAREPMDRSAGAAPPPWKWCWALNFADRAYRASFEGRCARHIGVGQDMRWSGGGRWRREWGDIGPAVGDLHEGGATDFDGALRHHLAAQRVIEGARRVAGQHPCK